MSISSESLINYASTYNNFTGVGMSQKQRVHNHLKQGKSLTSAEAYEQLGIVSFPKRICEVKEMGVKVKDRWKRVKTRFGEYTRVKEYYL
jgi:hypothetical protein